MTKVITVSELVANIRCLRNGKTFLTKFVNQCEFSNAVIIPPNATNGDIIKAMFPLVSIATDGTYVHVEMRTDGMKTCAGFYASWWNAPYEAKKE